MGIYTILESINQKYIFVYVSILLAFILYFRKKDVRLNLILALFIGYLIIWYIYEKNRITDNIEEEQQKSKLGSIIPKPKKLKSYDDVLDLIFSVQDFYRYNPQAYEELIDNIDAFFVIYEKIFITQYLCEDNYQIADSKKQNALNSLHSMIYQLPNNKIMTDKLNRAHKRLETLLNRYLNEIHDKCREKIIKRGRDINTRAINTGPKEYNTYFNVDKDFTYQFYLKKLFEMNIILMSRNRRDRYTFITADEYKDTFDEEYFTFFYQLATHPHPKTNRYHMKKYIVNNKDQIKGVNDYMLTKNKYDKFLKSKKLHEYKLYSVYSLNDVGLPHGADISASKSTILNNNYDYSGYAPF